MEQGPDVAAIRHCLQAYASNSAPERPTEKAAVKSVLRTLSEAAPGRSVEVRVAPYAAVQIISGPTHRRGTPPACVQMAPRTLIQLATGEQTWAQAVEAGLVRASGARSDLSALFPLTLDS